MTRLPYTLCRRLHAAGYTDSDIARRVGACQPSVSRYLRRHGLLPNPEPYACVCRRERDKTDRQRDEEAAQAAVLGWPGCRLVEAQTLNRLSLYPHETAELVEALAMSRGYVERVLKRLIHAGLVERIGGRRPLYRGLRLRQSGAVWALLTRRVDANTKARTT